MWRVEAFVRGCWVSIRWVSTALEADRLVALAPDTRRRHFTPVAPSRCL
jgi:hypothetical protein